MPRPGAVKRIKPLVPKPVTTPQCCVKFDPKQFQAHYLRRREERCAEHGLKIDQCTRPSSFRIDGKNYCTMHAGQVALRILTEEQD